MDRASANAGGHKVISVRGLPKLSNTRRPRALRSSMGCAVCTLSSVFTAFNATTTASSANIGGVLLGDDSGFKNVRSYCELCWPQPNSTCRTVAAAGAVSRPDPQGRCVNVSLLFQHGESAEDTVFTERAVCFRRQHCPIGLPIHAMHRHSGPRRPGMTGHPHAPQLRRPAAEPQGATPGGPPPPHHGVAPANTDRGFSVITVPSARPSVLKKKAAGRSGPCRVAVRPAANPAATTKRFAISRAHRQLSQPYWKYSLTGY